MDPEHFHETERVGHVKGIGANNFSDFVDIFERNRCACSHRVEFLFGALIHTV